MLAPTDDVIDPQGRLGKGTNSVGDQSDHDICKKRETEPAKCKKKKKSDLTKPGAAKGSAKAKLLNAKKKKFMM